MFKFLAKILILTTLQLETIKVVNFQNFELSWNCGPKMKSFDHWELVNHKIRQKSKFLAMYDFLAIILIYDCFAPGNDKSYQYFFFL